MQMKSPKWLKEELTYLKANYANLGSKGCSIVLKRTPRAIGARANILGLKRDLWKSGKRKWTEKEEDFLKKNFSNLGSDKISEILTNHNKNSIQHKAKKLKLKLNKQTKTDICRRGSFKRPNVHIFDETPFLKVQTKEIAYLLGLMWADGYLCKSNGVIGMSIVSSDFNDIKDIINLTGNWVINHRHRVNRQPQSSITTTNPQLFSLLKEKLYHLKSGYSCQTIVNHIPSSLQKYWWRGYSDGDGCFYWNQKSKYVIYTLASTYDQDWTAVEAILKKLDILYKIHRREQSGQNGKTHKSSIIRITGKSNIIKWGNFLYSDWDGIGFQRKRDKWLKVFG